MLLTQAVVALALALGLCSVPVRASSGNPLTDAIKDGDVTRVRELLAQSPDLVNARNSYGGTSLHGVAYNGTREMAKLLLAAGAGVNARTDLGDTPLHHSVSGGHSDLCRLLLAKGADLNARNIVGQTPIQASLYSGDMRLTRLLAAKGAKLDIFSAAALGKVEEVAALLSASPRLAKAWAPSGLGETALHWAAAMGHEDVAQLLLDKGADVNAGAGSCGTPLHWAACNGHVGVIRLLLANGASVNAEGGFLLGTPLHWTTVRGREQAARVLLAAGADVNAQDTFRDSGTPLHWAAALGRKGVAELLLANGAEVDAKASLMATGLHYLAEKQFHGAPRLLRVLAAEAGVIVKEQPEQSASAPKSKEDEERDRQVQRRLDDGRSGFTPLHWAAYWGNKGVARALLAHGADVNAEKEWLGTPLLFAGMDDEMAALLRRHGGTR